MLGVSAGQSHDLLRRFEAGLLAMVNDARRRDDSVEISDHTVG
jgi:hypothetical protein